MRKIDVMAHKFRCSIYIDIFVQEHCKHCKEVPKWWDEFKCTNPTGHEMATLEDNHKVAQAEIEDISSKLPNSYVGGVATMDEILLNKVEI
jgi:hypothetical protein